ncbi:hypothetical protein sos41_34160 [Alphaproteobacteria bacterium SO-S41]|nr:hypothetical protein sos41_34160 [Alphaproteobacteria bacterium SO-S41]
MGFRELFIYVSAAVFAGALTAWTMKPKSVVIPPTTQNLQVQIAPPSADDLPAPRPPKPPLPARLAAAGFELGDPAFVRIIKNEAVLEVWLKRGAAYEKFDTFPICYFSGALGPKQREGDHQSPEGFYEVSARQLNPNSAYHLAFNLGYPNALDRSLKRTGSALMVHGNCMSIGCYAMTDYGITEIYALVSGALSHGQRSVPVHIFPFRMTDEAMARAAGHDALAFWMNLKEGYDAFEASHVPPAVFACNGRYAFGAPSDAACDRVTAW